MVKIVVATVGIAVLLLMSCTHSSISWETLSKEKGSYCTQKFKDKEQLEMCEITYLAVQRAQKECQNFTHPEYCLVLAQHSWENYIKYVIKGKPTKEDANKYPMICEGGETNR